MIAELRKLLATPTTSATVRYAASDGLAGNHTGGVRIDSAGVFTLLSTIHTSGNATATQQATSTVPNPQLRSQPWRADRGLMRRTPGD